MRPRLAATSIIVLIFQVLAAGCSDRAPDRPRFIEFDASADHDRMMPDGRPMLERYVVELSPVGHSGPARTIDLGKPEPTDGRLRLEIPPDLPPGEYEVRVSSEGPGGRATSSDVVRFTMPGR